MFICNLISSTLRESNDYTLENLDGSLHLSKPIASPPIPYSQSEGKSLAGLGLRFVLQTLRHDQFAVTEVK